MNDTAAAPVSAALSVTGLYSTAEWAVIALSISLIAVYFAVHAAVVVRQPMKTTLGINLAERRRWIKSMMAGSNQLLVVQTIRNGIMTSTYFATSASTIALYVLAEAVKKPLSIQQVQLLTVGAVMLGAFLNFLHSIRALNSIGYLSFNGPASVDPADPEDQQLPAAEKTNVAISLMNKATVHYSYGIKFFFLVVPVGFWIFSPYALLGGALLLVAYFVWSDRV